MQMTEMAAHSLNHNIKHVIDLDLLSTDGTGEPTTNSVQISAWFLDYHAL
jgi:hypothetical protein